MSGSAPAASRRDLVPIADWLCLMQDDLNGVSGNVSIFATITLVIVSALNPALWGAHCT